MKLLLATANEHKIRELTALLRPVQGLDLFSIRDFPHLEMPEETGHTMRENARLKAIFCARATGLVALADDSGIEVDALNGQPGVYSARWIEGSDLQRTQAILDRLQLVPVAERTARYRCVICIAQPDGEVYEQEATCEGRIGFEMRGENGFGYDPIFELTPESGAPVEYSGRTMAEVPAEIKASISHRARAVQAVQPWLEANRSRL